MPNKTIEGYTLFVGDNHISAMLPGGPILFFPTEKAKDEYLSTLHYSRRVAVTVLPCTIEIPDHPEKTEQVIPAPGKDESAKALAAHFSVSLKEEVEGFLNASAKGNKVILTFSNKTDMDRIKGIYRYAQFFAGHNIDVEYMTQVDTSDAQQ